MDEKRMQKKQIISGTKLGKFINNNDFNWSQYKSLYMWSTKR